MLLEFAPNNYNEYSELSKINSSVYCRDYTKAIKTFKKFVDCNLLLAYEEKQLMGYVVITPSGHIPFAVVDRDHLEQMPSLLKETLIKAREIGYKELILFFRGNTKSFEMIARENQITCEVKQKGYYLNQGDPFMQVKYKFSHESNSI